MIIHPGMRLEFPKMLYGVTAVTGTTVGSNPVRHIQAYEPQTLRLGAGMYQVRGTKSSQDNLALQDAISRRLPIDQ